MRYLVSLTLSIVSTTNQPPSNSYYIASMVDGYFDVISTFK
jgi:hypothetical protein